MNKQLILNPLDVRLKDGKHMINVYSRSSSLLGQWLSNWTKEPFDMPKFGRFDSIEGFWFWYKYYQQNDGVMSVAIDGLRRMSGYTAKEFGSKHVPSEIPDFDDFQEKIYKALDLKLKTNKAMMKLFADSTLPLVHYYEYDGIRKMGSHPWVINHLDHRRQQLKLYYKEKID